MITFRILQTLILLLVPLLFHCSSNPTHEFPVLTGDYLGQQPPTAQEKLLFAPGIVSNGLANRDVAITPDGNEMYFGTGFGNFVTILRTKRINGQWSEPEIVPFGGEFFDFEPCLTPDGNRMYFLSNRPTEGKEPKAGWYYQNIWYVERKPGEEWGEPINTGSPINTDNAEYFPSMTSDGTLYFTREAARQSAIYRSKFENGEFSEPERLSETVNSGNPYNGYISPDESFLITCMAGGEGSFSQADYYIFFRDENDNWSSPVNLGGRVNTPGAATSPYVTPDGKYFFFGSREWETSPALSRGTVTLSEILEIYNNPKNGSSDIYWIEASFIKNLYPGNR